MEWDVDISGGVVEIAAEAVFDGEGIAVLVKLAELVASFVVAQTSAEQGKILHDAVTVVKSLTRLNWELDDHQSGPDWNFQLVHPWNISKNDFLFWGHPNLQHPLNLLI